jgi:hypothetical protein
MVIWICYCLIRNGPAILLVGFFRLQYRTFLQTTKRVLNKTCPRLRSSVVREKALCSCWLAHQIKHMVPRNAHHFSGIAHYLPLLMVNESRNSELSSHAEWRPWLPWCGWGGWGRSCSFHRSPWGFTRVMLLNVVVVELTGLSASEVALAVACDDGLRRPSSHPRVAGRCIAGSSS